MFLNPVLDQAVFFVGTAPLDGAGHVNVSPKGMSGTFAVLGPHRVAYLDYTGSGTETIAHLRENRAHRVDVLCLRRATEHRASARARARHVAHHPRLLRFTPPTFPRNVPWGSARSSWSKSNVSSTPVDSPCP